MLLVFAISFVNYFSLVSIVFVPFPNLNVNHFIHLYLKTEAFSYDFFSSSFQTIFFFFFTEAALKIHSYVFSFYSSFKNWIKLRHFVPVLGFTWWVVKKSGLKYWGSVCVGGSHGLSKLSNQVWKWGVGGFQTIILGVCVSQHESIIRTSSRTYSWNACVRINTQFSGMAANLDLWRFILSDMVRVGQGGGGGIGLSFFIYVYGCSFFLSRSEALRKTVWSPYISRII